MLQSIEQLTASRREKIRTPFLNHYDLVRVVSLPERQDRRRDMRHELIKLGAILPGDDLGDPAKRISFFDAYRMDGPGVFYRNARPGCYIPHLSGRERAAARDQSVLILQDDCDFTSRTVMTDLADCDIFYGGYHLVGDQTRPHECDIIGAHFMGFSARAARLAATYLRSLLDLDVAPDAIAAGKPGFNPAVRPPIDGSLVWFRRAHPELVTRFELVSVQRSSRTDCGTPHLLDNVTMLRNIVGGGRRIGRYINNTVGLRRTA